MNVITASEARATLKQTMDTVCRDHMPTIVTRQRGEPVIMMSLADYNSMQETLYLLSSENNARRLRESGKCRLMSQKAKARNKLQAKEVALAWTDHAWQEYVNWQAQDMAIVEEINRLLEECKRDPFRGTGKPEPLRGDLSGFWSRRITREHRLVYLPEGGIIYVVQCKFHY